jgi:hypothetical protein
VREQASRQILAEPPLVEVFRNDSFCFRGLKKTKSYLEEVFSLSGFEPLLVASQRVRTSVEEDSI